MKKRDKRRIQGDALKRRIRMGQEKSKGYKSNIFPQDKEIPLWNPKDGDHIIDIVPYHAGKNDPFTDKGEPTYTFEYKIHRIGPNNTEVICLGMYDKPCPVCDHRNNLRDKDDEKYKDFWPKTRHLYNVIVYGDKNETRKGVQVWDVSYHYFEKNLIAISRKPSRDGKKEKTINFVDPNHGQSVTFTITPPKSKKDYRKYEGHAFDQRDYKLSNDILDSAFCLDELVHIPTYDEVKELFDGGKGSRGENRGTDDAPLLDEDEIAKIIDEINSADDTEEILDILDDNHLDKFIDINPDEKLRKAKKAAVEALEELMVANGEVANGEAAPDPDDDDDDDKSQRNKYFNPELLYDELSEVDDIKGIRKFCKKYNIEYSPNRDKSLKFNEKKVRKLLEEKAKEYNSGSSSGGTTRDDLEEMDYDELIKFIKKNKISLDEDDYDENDIEDIIDDICIELDIE